MVSGVKVASVRLVGALVPVTLSMTGDGAPRRQLKTTGFQTCCGTYEVGGRELIQLERDLRKANKTCVSRSSNTALEQVPHSRLTCPWIKRRP